MISMAAGVIGALLAAVTNDIYPLAAGRFTGSCGGHYADDYDSDAGAFVSD